MQEEKVAYWQIKCFAKKIIKENAWVVALHGADIWTVGYNETNYLNAECKMDRYGKKWIGETIKFLFLIISIIMMKLKCIKRSKESQLVGICVRMELPY